MSDNVKRAIELLQAEIAMRRQELARLEQTVSQLSRQLPAPASDATAPLHSPPAQPTRAIAWSTAISEIFHKYDNLKLREVCMKLVEEGLVDSIDSARKASVSSTLTRKVQQGELVKAEDGTYSRNEPNNSFDE